MMYKPETSPYDNSLIARLSPDGIEDLHLEAMWLPSGTNLLPVGERIEYLYFPTTAIVAVVGNIANGRAAEVGVFGRECVAGFTALLGRDTPVLTRAVQIPGEVFRTRLDAVQREFDECPDFRKAVLGAAQDFTNQVGMTVICNRWHPIEQRLIRWLLMRHDRLDGDTLPVTHEYLAQMLGAHRSTVTLAANHLQELGLIKYTWGKVTISNRRLMEKSVCECYTGPPATLKKDEFIEELLAVGFS